MHDAGQGIRWAAESAAVVALLGVVHVLPLASVRRVANALSWVTFRALSHRRRVAVDNIRQALGVDRATAEDLALRSVQSFAMTALPEVVKLRRRLTGPEASLWLRTEYPHVVPVFERAHQLHVEHRGCIFVTPHLGNWELLPYSAAAFDIELTVPVRPLDNPHLERRLARARAATGQRFVNRRHGLLGLANDLTRGRSLAILADQATVGGPRIEFFGRPAHTSPVPALLAVRYRRPIVVVACVRTEATGFSGWIGEPVRPDDDSNECESIQVQRLTAAMNREMERVIRLYPDQYLWMHDRWKSYGPHGG